MKTASSMKSLVSGDDNKFSVLGVGVVPQSVGDEVSRMPVGRDLDLGSGGISCHGVAENPGPKSEAQRGKVTRRRRSWDIICGVL